MTFSDYLLDSGLILIVLLQLRGRKLSLMTVALPLGIVGYVASQYLRSIPTGGNDVLLVGLAVAAGLLFGVGAGLTTKVFRNGDGVPTVKAGAAAATLWVLGTGGRLAFSVYATHGGGASIERFSGAHHITTTGAWADALILMALVEVVSRTVILLVRALRAGLLDLSTIGAGRPAMMGARARQF